MKISVVSPESVRAAVSFLRQANDIMNPDEPSPGESIIAWSHKDPETILSQMRHAKRLIEHAILELTSEEVQGG